MMLKDDDIFLVAIKRTAEKYVKDNVKVIVYETKLIEYGRKYTLQLDYSVHHTKYELDNRYCNQRTYIMRVVSDLCINLAEMTQRERNDFFKISDEEDELDMELNIISDEEDERLNKENGRTRTRCKNK